MSRKSEAYFRDVPMKPYDLLREGLVVFLFLAGIIFVLAAVFGSPDYPPVNSHDVAKYQPVAYLKTTANILAGNSGIQDYGPPYTSDTANVQQVLSLAPAAWFGVRYPLDASRDFVLKPLERVAAMDKGVARALKAYEAVGHDRQQTWLKAYLAALDKAAVNNGEVQVPAGDYGPVPVLMNGMLGLGRAGLLEGALDSSAWTPFNLDFTRSLLFFSEDVDGSVADNLNMSGEQMGISHETGPFPGAWWLMPYAALYQIPFMSASPNADLLAGVIMIGLFLVLLFIPFLPVLNRVPFWVKIYRIIWRDWYSRSGEDKSA
ncbi:MAG TPA: hypothetical protein ENH32_04045 [Proteobacteria bacterium]|nr:hypothetical protein BMS3Abin14_01581 [bacterium BMS3Abin14]HDL53124.1 hypothetical protein [Pseudomonadota bacterium]